MKRGTSRHPKTEDLAERLSIPASWATGILASLWDWAAEYAHHGNVGKYSNTIIAKAVTFPVERADELIEAMVLSRWLDRSEEHRVIIHDWPEHCEDSVHARLARAVQLFADGSVPNLKKLGKDERDRVADAYKELIGAKRRPNNAGDSLPPPPPPTCPPTRPKEGEAAGAADLTPDDFMSAWNEEVQFSPIRVMSEPRKSALRSRKASADWRRDWRPALAKIRGSPFLRGENDRNWKADVDWFLRPDTVTKILEGKYDGSASTNGRTSRPLSGVEPPPGKYDKIKFFGEGEEAKAGHPA
jgi:hypothetical protein